MNGLIIEPIFIALSLLSLISLPLAIWSLIEVMAFKRSTHKVQFINPLANLPREELSKEETDNLDKLNSNSVDPNYRHIDRFWSGN